MLDIDDEVLKRLDELDAQLAPLLAEARDILERTRPGFRPFSAWTFAAMYTARAVGPETYYARQREKAVETRRRNAETKRMMEPQPTPPPAKAQSVRKRPFWAGKRRNRQVAVAPATGSGTIDW